MYTDYGGMMSKYLILYDPNHTLIANFLRSSFLLEKWLINSINTEYTGLFISMTNPTIVYLVKMELWVKLQHFLHNNDVEKWSRNLFFENPPGTSHFLFEFTPQKVQYSCGISSYDKLNFKPQISSIFHFDRVSDN